MSNAGRISPSTIGPTGRISAGTEPQASTPSPQANISLPQADAPAPQPGPRTQQPVPPHRNDSGRRLKLVGPSPENAIRDCRKATADISERIQRLIKAAHAPDALVNAAFLTPLIEAHEDAEQAYEQALAVLRRVPGIVSRERSNPGALPALKEFLAKRDHACLSRKLCQALQHTVAADDAMQQWSDRADTDEVKRQGLAALPAAYKNYGKAVDLLCSFKPAELTIAQQVPYQEIADALGLLEHALFNEIRYAEQAFNQALDELRKKIGPLWRVESGALSELRTERAAILDEPASSTRPRPQAQLRRLAAIDEQLRTRSSRLLAQLPQNIKDCKALLPFNADLTRRLILERSHFPDSAENHDSLLAAILVDIRVHKDINDLHALNLHEFLHRMELDSPLNDAQFEHLNRIHRNVMLLYRFFNATAEEITDIPGKEQSSLPAASLDLLASTFDTASQQLRYHSHIVLGKSHTNQQYRHAASLLGELAEDYLATSRQARLAKDRLVEYEYIADHPQGSAAADRKTILTDVDWDLPPWLADHPAGKPENAAAAMTAAMTAAMAATSMTSPSSARNPGKKAAPSGAETLPASQEGLRSAEKLEQRSIHFSALGAGALHDAQSRLAQMQEGTLSDQHSWSTIRFLMQVACENREKELDCIGKALDRLQPLQDLPDVSPRISQLRKKAKTLKTGLDHLRRDAMRHTLDAIMRRPTDQGIQYLHEQGKIAAVARPNWVELKDPDDEFREERLRGPKHYVIEHVLTFKADANAPNRWCVLHAHYDRPDPPYGTRPMKSHYKRYEERLLGKASETRLADGSIFNPVYRSQDASKGLEIVHGMLAPELRTPVPRSQAKTTGSRR